MEEHDSGVVGRARTGVLAFLVWLWSVSGQMWSRAPGRFLFAISARVFAQFAQLFSFFIPLKVIILMGSSHIPAYFQSVMTIENRNVWIAGLALATVFLYLSAIVSEWLAGRLEAQAARLFLPHMDKACLYGKEQRNSVRRMVVALCRIHVSLVIAALCIFALLVMNPLMIIILLVLLLAQLAIIGWSARQDPKKWTSRLGRAIKQSPKRYFRTLAALDFLALFGLLLAQYWVEGAYDTVAAILILLLGRRLFQSMANGGIRMVRVNRERQKIDELFNMDKPIREI